MKRKIHKTKSLKTGISFSIACRTPATKTTMHAYADRDVTCKRCQVITAVGAVARGAVVN